MTWVACAGSVAGELAGAQAQVECPLTVGRVPGVVPADSNRSWYPFWFLVSFLTDTAEALSSDFGGHVGADTMQLEVHRLCMHALQIAAASPLHKYRLAL